MAVNEQDQEKQETITADELHVESMSVDTLRANIYMDLADLTDAMAKQTKEQLQAFKRLNGHEKDENGTENDNTKSSQTDANIDQNNPNQDHSVNTTETKSGQLNTISGMELHEIKPEKPENGSGIDNHNLNGLRVLESKRRILALDEPRNTENKPNKTRPQNTELANEKVKAPVSVVIERTGSEYKPADARKKRTIELGEQIESPAATVSPKPATTATEVPPDQNSKNNGYYVDVNGRLRRPDGKYASKVEVRRYNKERNQDVDEKNAEKSGSAGGGSDKQLSAFAKAFAKLTGRAAQTDAADAAGVAVGGSFWLAGKEISDLVTNFKESLQLRKINSVKDAKSYAKDKATKVGSVITAPVRAGKWLVNRVTGKKKTITTDPSGEQEQEQEQQPDLVSASTIKKQSKQSSAAIDSVRSDTVAPVVQTTTSTDAPARSGANPTPVETGSQPAPLPSRSAKSNAAPINKSKADYEQGIKEKADEARSEKQISVIETTHIETQQVLEEILDELKPKKSSLIDNLLSGKKMLDTLRGRSGQRGRGSATRTRRNPTAGKRYRTKKAGALSTAGDVLEDLGDLASDSQSIDIDTTREPKKHNPDIDKDGKAKGKAKGRKVVRSNGRRSFKLGGATQGGVVKKSVGAISRVFGAIPQAISEIPSVVTAAGVTGGKMLPVMETVGKGAVKGATSAGKGVAAIGKGALELTGKGVLAGARALPLVGQALSVGLAGYDAYNGYNDTEAQKGIFNLKDGQEANTLQKSSTAAASVLDLGGLTSGLSGLLGDAAGFFGMKNTQDALSFDSGDMAKTMYDSVTGESARKAMGVEDAKDMSIGQSLASGAATVLDMGGLTSFLSKGIGSLVEDLGVTGAKDAMSFDTGSIAKTIYSPFSATGPIGKMATAVTDFSSDTIVGAINDLIDTVKRKDEGDTSINNFSSASSWSSGGSGSAPASNWAGTAKGIDVPAIVQQQQESSGLPEGYLGGVLGVESRGDPSAKNKSGAAGLWQFMPKTVSGMGGFNPFDPVESTKKMIEFTKTNAAYFQKTMGRDATGRELYLMHQQGMGGGTNLMKNPDALASSVVGAKAVTQNGGNLNMTARQFAELQMSKYDRQVAANQTTIPLRSGVNPKDANGLPPMIAAPVKSGTASAAPIADSNIPVMIRRPVPTPVDIQKAKEAKDSKSEDIPKEPLVAKMDPQMTKLLSNIESALKQQNKASGGTTGGQGGTGRNSVVSGHDYVSGHMSDLVRDRG